MHAPLPYASALVTGSTGFVGGKLIAALAERGIEVHGLALEGNDMFDHVPNVHMHTGDLTDKVFMHEFMQQIRPDVIFHLAAYGTFTNEQDAQRMIDVNVKGLFTLLEASRAADCKAFIATSSAKVYTTGRIPVLEDQPMSPWDNYAATKASAEFFCKLYAEKDSFPVTTIRLSPVYGPGDALSRFIPTAIRSAVTNSPFTCSVGPLVRNFTYIDDAIEAFLHASMRMTGTYEVFNIGHPQAHSFDDILHAIELATRRTMNIIIPPTDSFVDNSWVLDVSKAKRVLDWEAKVSLEEGVTQTVQWYAQVRA